MLPALLPIKASDRALIVESASALQPFLGQINAAWRRRMFEEFHFDGRIMLAMERLNLGVGFQLFSQSDFSVFSENLEYYGRRLARLAVDTRAAARSLEIFQELLRPYLARVFGDRQFQVGAALEALASATFVAVSGAYFDAQQSATTALLQVMEAELNAPNLSALLNRVLEITTSIFPATCGLLLLRDPETQRLRVQSATGFSEARVWEVSIADGDGFTGQVAATGEPAIMSDLARGHSVLEPMLREHTKSLWGVPLKIDKRVTGVLLLGFSQSYAWLPSELDLLRAIADRSALGIDRAAILDALREREARIAELSAHLIRAQEEERKRISRELHDETGQSLMVIRLYLGMLEADVGEHVAQPRIQELFSVVDRTIEGIRRIIARLSPLVLQELGLLAAIRKEAKDLKRTTGVKVHVTIAEDIGRLLPELETAIYRVVQESLHNVAQHAHATSVEIRVAREKGALRLTIEDDGVGLASAVKRDPHRRSFGLAGMRERISALGGTVSINGKKGHGTRVAVIVPVPERISLDGSGSGRAASAGAHTNASRDTGT